MQMEQLHAQLITRSKTNYFFLAVLAMITILLTFVRGKYSFYSHTSFHVINYTVISCLKFMVILLCSKEELPRKIQNPVYVFHLKFIYQLFVLSTVCTYRLWTALINDSAVRKWPSSRFVCFTYICLTIFSLSQKSYRQKLSWYVNSEL